MNARPVLLLVVVFVAACGGSGARSAGSLRSCVAERVPPGAVDRTSVSTAEGVTSFDYMHAGDEVVVSVFPSVKDAEHALEEEARIGDAHDTRTRNVLHSGGGVVEKAVVDCLR